MKASDNIPSQRAMEIAESLHDWMSKQKYGDENILHSAVICDFVGQHRFKNAMARLIDESLSKDGELVRLLIRLVSHCWVHSGYQDCGSRKMESDIRRIYDAIVSLDSECGANEARGIVSSAAQNRRKTSP